MLNRDISHIGDSQSPQWWGVKNGLVFDGINDYMEIPIDASFRAAYNQNTVFAVECWVNGQMTMTNISGAFVGQTFMVYFICVGAVQHGFKQDVRQTVRAMNVSVTTLRHIVGSYDASRNSNSDTFRIWMNRNRVFNIDGSGDPDTDATDNVWNSIPNWLRVGRTFFPNADGFLACRMRDLRIYSRQMTDNEVDGNYHGWTQTNTGSMLARYNLASAADFNVSGGNLFALDSSGNGRHAQLFGMGTTPVLASMY